eukprot:jgi/Tetstr1/421618/TSEL_012559.t1
MGFTLEDLPTSHLSEAALRKLLGGVIDLNVVRNYIKAVSGAAPSPVVITVCHTSYGTFISSDGEAWVLMDSGASSHVNAHRTDIYYMDIPVAEQFLAGLAERSFCTIGECAQAMLLHAGLDRTFWDWAYLHAVYLYNRQWSSSVNDIPCTLMTGRKPDLTDLHVFGCVAWVNISVTMRAAKGKMTPKSWPGIYDGRHEDSAGYHIYNPATMREIVTRNVVFDETAWAFAEKHDKDGNFIKRKARVVVRGDQLTAGENYYDTKTYAPVGSFIALRTTIALAVQLDWELYQFDVTCAFLNANLDEDEALYGLPQAPKAWFLRFSSFLRDFGFVNSECDPGLWTLLAVDGSLLAILCFYVDDIMLATSPSSDIHERCQTSLITTFDATTDGLCTWLLGMAIDRKPGGVIHLHSEKYINDILTTLNMTACTPRRLPRTPDTDFHDPTVAYRARVQKSVALSIAEAEFVALCMACKCMAFIRFLLRQLNHPTTYPVRVCEDNQACIVQVKHGMITGAQRHIDLKFQYAPNSA